MENITLTMNGKNVSCRPGTTILEAADQNGIKIPRLCYHPDLEPAGACRLCLVEDEKRGRLMASCVAPVVQDMVIRTDSPRIINHRRNIIRLMMAEHPESCLVCLYKTRCLRSAMEGEEGLAVREEKLERAEEAGMIGFLDRWSRKKALHKKKKKQT